MKFKIDRLMRTETWSFAILLCTVAVVPVYMRLSVDPLTEAERALYGIASYSDIFTRCKSDLLFVMSFIGFVVSAGSIWRHRAGLKSKSMAAAALFFILTITSAWFSHYPVIVAKGLLERYENLGVWLAYGSILMLGTACVRSESRRRLLMTWISAQTILIGAVAFMQYYGFNILNWLPMRALIAGSTVASANPQIAVDSVRAYGTLGNPDYLGLYGAMMLTLSVGAISIESSKRILERIAIAFAAIMILVSGSGAALLASACGITVLLYCHHSKQAPIKPEWVLWPLVIGIIMVLPRIMLVQNGENMLLVMIIAGIIGAGVFAGRYMKTHWMRNVFLICCFFLVAVVIGLGWHKTKYNEFIQSMTMTPDGITLVTQEGTVTIEVKDIKLWIRDQDGGRFSTPIDSVRGKLITGLRGVDALELGLSHTQDGKDILTLHRTGFRFSIENNRLVLLDKTGQNVVLQNPEKWGFENHGQVLSCRGYIWSRSIPLLRNSLLIGSGPDTFVFMFPQYDYGGKFNYFGTADLIIDKPHSLYLQLAIQNGVAAMIALLIMIGAVCREAWEARHAGAPWLGLIAAFLVGSIFNDSYIPLTLFFWLGIGVIRGCRNT